MPVIVRKPRVEIRAGIPMRELYQAVLDALGAWSDQQADAFAADAVYATTRDDLVALAKRYVDLVELPSA